MKNYILTILTATFSLLIQFAATAQPIPTTGDKTNYDTVYSSYQTYYSLEEALKAPLNVQKLDLSMNKITALSPDIGKFPNLIYLDLSFNTFSTLPAELASLKKLEYLNISGTRFMGKVPTVIYSMPWLKTVDIGDHPEWPAANFADAHKRLPNVLLIH